MVLSTLGATMSSMKRMALSLTTGLSLAFVACGGTEPKPRDPLSTVRAFYDATVDGDADTACRLLTPSAERLLTVKVPPPSCRDAIGQVHERLSVAERESMTKGLKADGAMRVTRRGSEADVDLATSDSSGAGIHLQMVDGGWRIEGIDPGAVDGGQPTNDPAAIRRLQRHAR